MPDFTEKLRELLLDFNLIKKAQYDEVVEEYKNSDKKFEDILIESGYITEEELSKVLEYQLGIPRVDLSKYVLDSYLSQYIPENIARRYQVIPLEQDENIIKVAMVDPTDIIAIDDIEMFSGLKVEPVIATRKDIKMGLNQIYFMSNFDTNEIFANLEDFESTPEEPEINELKAMVEDAPIVRLANLIINRAVQTKASDIHIEPEERDIRVRYRVDGVLKESMIVPKSIQAALISRFKIIADLDITVRRVPQDGRVEMRAGGIKIDMRVSTLPTIYGEKIVIRLLNRDEQLLNVDKLGFSNQNLTKFKKLIKKPNGILLVTGPTGSGKSTTLFAALNRLNSPEKNIVTIEDPVEYKLKGINQVQAKPKAGLDFARTLRSILRQDPDIIMIGEIRDEETARIAVRAALTGHLVLTTLHTNDAISSINRMLDMGIPPYLVSSAVIGVIAQRLVRKLCENCKEKYQPGVEEKNFLGENSVETLYRSEGCKKCNSTGFVGRIPIQEILVVDDTMREMIINSSDKNEIKKYALQEGMVTLREDGKQKLIEGQTSYDELIKAVI